MVAQTNPLRPANYQYHMGLGAMSHCTLHHEDFVEFTHIKLQAICGMASTSIAIIGIGKIKLHLGKSW